MKSVDMDVKMTRYDTFHDQGDGLAVSVDPVSP